MRSPLYPLALRLLAGAVVVGSAASAHARTPSVYINNVKVDGLAGQTLTNVDVTFDEHGDVRITAKGYKVQSSEPEKPAATSPVSAASGHRFYIATMSPPGRTGMAQWEIDVYINQTFVKKFRSKDPDPIFDITRFLKPGANVIHFTAKKEEGDRASTSPNDYFELVLGDGEMRAGQVMLNRISSYRRTAAESGTFNSETTLDLAPGAAP